MGTDTETLTHINKQTDYNKLLTCKRIDKVISLSMVPEALYEVVYRDLIISCTNTKMFILG